MYHCFSVTHIWFTLYLVDNLDFRLLSCWWNELRLWGLFQWNEYVLLVRRTWIWGSGWEIPMLKTIPHCDVIGRWGLWEVFRSEERDSPLTPSSMWKHRKKVAICEPASWPSPDTKSADDLILNFLASSTEKYIFVVYKLPSLWCFVKVAQTDQDALGKYQSKGEVWIQLFISVNLPCVFTMGWLSSSMKCITSNTLHFTSTLSVFLDSGNQSVSHSWRGSRSSM